MLSLINLNFLGSVKGFCQILFASPIPSLFKPMLMLTSQKHSWTAKRKLWKCVSVGEANLGKLYPVGNIWITCIESIAVPPSGHCCCSLCLHCSLLHPNPSFRISPFGMQRTVFQTISSDSNCPALYLSTWRRWFGFIEGVFVLIAGPSAFSPLSLLLRRFPFCTCLLKPGYLYMF